MLYRVPHLIAGKVVDVQGRELPIYRPDMGEQVGIVSVADQAVVQQAVAAAKTAYFSWSRTTPAARAQLLFKYKTLLDAHTLELATMVSREHGKTIEEAVGSVKRGIEVVDFACGIPALLKGSYSADVSQGIDAYSIYQPLGVCVGITPFNFPAMIPLWMLSMAIACGNTFILKPSEKDPSVAVMLIKLLQEAGVPDGVVNVVQGDGETVDLLITHQDVQAVSFVGSSKIASEVYNKSIAHHKRAQAFGGAKNHCVVMPDADLAKAADSLVAAAYGSAGERCMAISVVVAVGDDVADKLIKLMTPKIENWRMGSGLAEKIDMGPLVTKQHLQRVKNYVDLGQKEGATLVIDGSKQSVAGSQGYFMAPCLFDHVDLSMRIYRDEIFGPVLCIVRVKSLDEAIALINQHEYANGCAIFTSDGYSAREFSHAINVGMVGVNVAVPIPAAYHGFGGWKQSCFADIGMYGDEAVRFYTRRKKITERWFAKESSS